MKTKQDYMQLGRECVQKEDGPEGFGAPFPASATSWQARAFWAGYNAEADAMQAQALLDRELQQMTTPLQGQKTVIGDPAMPEAAKTLPAADEWPAHWPAGAKAHASALRDDLFSGKQMKVKRLLRLSNSLNRLCLRHSNLTFKQINR